MCNLEIKGAMRPCSFVIEPFKMVINNDVCKSVNTSNKMVDILCKPVHVNTSMNLHQQTESKKGYLFLYPSLCLSYSDNKHRAIASSFAKPFPTFKPFLFV